MKAANPGILTINGGSSSIKFALYHIAEPLKRGLYGKVDRIGLSGTNLAFHDLTQKQPCLPTGVPRGAPYPWRIAQTPSIYFILFEGNIHSCRQIFMNGKHPDDPDPAWYGHSIGRWDKDTLVVDSVGFNDKFWFDYLGHPHTEKLHTIERYTRTDLGNLTIEVTIDDPGAYTKPFTTVGRARL